MLDSIIQGDCVKEMRRLPEAYARLVVADPPYYNVLTDEDWDTQWRSEDDYLEWSLVWMNEAMRLLVPGGLLYCFGQTGKREHAMLHLMSAATREWDYHDLVIWDRSVGYNERRDSWTPAYEMILVLRKPGGTVFFDKDAVREPYDKATVTRYARDRRYRDRAARMRHLLLGKFATNLWRIPSLKGASREKIGHPSQKPLSLVARIVLSSSAPGDLVIDPFIGSGTTAVAARAHGRHFVGIDASRTYVQMSRNRLRGMSDTLTPRGEMCNEDHFDRRRTGNPVPATP